MNRSRALLSAALVCAALFGGPVARAVELPPICHEQPLVTDETTPIAELRARVEALAASDPLAAVGLMCATIPRVAREQGDDSVELAWWVGSLATPLIAYMDRFAEALPLLEFSRRILETRLGPEAPEVAEIHVAYAWTYFRQGRLAESGTEWQTVVRIREIVPGPQKIELQKALVGLAQVQLAQRDFAGARGSLDRAHAILEQNAETVSEAAAAIENAYVNLALREEDYVAARAHAEAQMAIETRLGAGTAQLVSGGVMLGRILERLDEFEEAERTLREAVRLAEAEEGPLQRHRLSALSALGELLNERGKAQEALEVGQRALEVGEVTLGPDAPILVRPLSNLAESHRALGRLPAALHLYERAGAIVELHRADIERPVLVAYYRGLGSLQLALGDTELARSTLTAGLEAAGDEPTLSTQRAAVLLALAEATRQLDQPGARTHLAEALALFRLRLPEGHPTIVRVIDDLCAQEVEESKEAAPDCDDARRRLEAGGEVEPALRQEIYGNLSLLAERRGEGDQAYALAVPALAAAAAAGTPDPLWRASFRMARLLHARGDATVATFFGKQAIAHLQRLRVHFVGEDRRFDRSFLHDKVAVYRTVADWLMEAGRIDEGLEVLSLLKTEELYEFALRDASVAAGQAGLSLTADEQALLERFERTLATDAAAGAEIDRLSRLRAVGRITREEQERLDGLLAGQRPSEAARAERIREFIAGGARPAAREESRSRDVQALRLEQELERAGPDTALAVYLLTETHLRILVAARGAQIERSVPVDAAALRRDIGRFLDAIGARRDVTVESRALYETLARPVDEVARRAGATRLVLWPDGALRYVPFAALSDGERYLVDRYAIEIRTGSAEGPRRDGTTSAPLTIRGLGVTQAVAGYPALPAVADELCWVVRGPITGLAAPGRACADSAAGNGLLAGEGFADSAFTESRLDALLGGPRDFSVLHVGTHFHLRPGNAMRSFLVLGDGSKLTLDHIGALDFSGIELLTLSSCQTGLGGAGTDDGREVEGLGAVVASRGAKRVVASLWQVEDESTALLMREMYRGLKSAQSDVPRALRRAQLALRSLRADSGRSYEHPYYWAGFVVSATAP